jgi:type I restriction enzyme, S subunit
MNNWIVTPLEQLADISSGGTPSRAIDDFWGGDIPWATPSDITKCKTNYLYNTQDSITWKGLSSSSAKLLPAGTLLFTSRATIGEVRIATKQISTNQGFKNLIAKDCIDADFLFYQVINLKNEFVKYAAGSTFLEINRKDTGRILIPHPVDKNKQEKISHVLKTIDRTITHTEALIEKYQQIKAGLMHDLFTRGIGADGKLRPPRDQAPEMYRESSIGWIPKEWSLESVEGLHGLVTSGSRDWAQYYSNEGVLFVRIGNLTREHINFRLEKVQYVLSPKNSDGQRTKLMGDDILVSITADLGIIGVIPNELGDAYINQHIALIRFSDKAINSRFFGHFFASQAFQKYVDRMNDGGAKAGLNLPTVRTFPVVMTSKNEQDTIVQRLDSIDVQVDIEKKVLLKLCQQKSGLMHDLLTGKVQVNSEEIT